MFIRPDDVRSEIERRRRRASRRLIRVGGSGFLAGVAAGLLGDGPSALIAGIVLAVSVALAAGLYEDL